MKTGNSHISDELLVKYLLGEASSEEQQQVQKWISESDANNKYYYHFKLLWDECRSPVATGDIDEDAAWSKFKTRTEDKNRKVVIPYPSPYRWMKIAASVVLLLSVGLLGYYFSNQNEPLQIVSKSVESPVNKTYTVKQRDTNEIITDEVAEQETPSETMPVVNSKAVSKQIALAKQPGFAKEEFHEPLHNNYHRTREYCNATQCALEICIIQTVKCPDGEPSAISTCSVLEPDESGQLRYKAFDKITKNCNATINEIRIKQVGSGETIVLNANSKPATAEDFFNYITGQKKGDILAGVFHNGCDDQTDNCGLTFDNNYGRLIMQ